ncbi:hypothetical protein ACFQZE_23360 [Paenibacillus sp. GCM10027627]|uniref:hypothetical protein n=1 Tax=unclassified Paenibacillus TaxID=185978 RepID=UPI00362CFA5C
MKKKLLSLLVLSSLFASSALANTVITGFTSGGPSGQLRVFGSITATNGNHYDTASASTGNQYYQYAYHEVTLRIYYNQPGGTSGYVDAYNSDSNNTYVTASAPHANATYATGSHYISSPDYGSWSGTTNVNY